MAERRKRLPARKAFIARSTKPIRAVNPVAKAKRDKLHAKDHRSAHTREVRRQAMERAGNRCEDQIDRTGQRCVETEQLQLHHLKYPRVRPLELRDVAILCRRCHEYAEAMKPHKWR